MAGPPTSTTPSERADVGPERAQRVVAGAEPVVTEPVDTVPPCSIAATLEVIGDRWTLLILRDIFRGVRRFSRLHDDLGIAKNILSDRLQKLVDAGVLETVQYQDRPPRHEYRLTAKGADLSPSLVALMHWGDHWYAADRPPTVLVHEACDTPLEQVTRCPQCHEEIAPNQIASRPGAGAPSHGDPA